MSHIVYLCVFRLARLAALFGAVGLIAISTTTAVGSVPSGEWVTTGGPAGTSSGVGTLLTLPDGSVLLIGEAVERYNPSTGAWSANGALHTLDRPGTATLLPSGVVLLTGGPAIGVTTNVAELFNPATGASVLTGAMHFARAGHAATLLASGKVLVSGGVDASNQLVGAAEIYDPSTGTWSLTGILNNFRTQHAAAPLPGGRVLVAGGGGVNGSLASAEVYDPVAGTWTLTNPMDQSRFSGVAGTLPDGRILVAGSNTGSNIGLLSSQLYDPATSAWSQSATITSCGFPPRCFVSSQGMVVLANGVPLVTVGSCSPFLISCGFLGTYLLDVQLGLWSLTTSPSGPGSSNRTSGMTPLADGRALLVSGDGGSNPGPWPGFLFRPDNTTPRLVESPQNFDFGHTHVGVAVQQVVNVQNTGGATLVGSAIVTAPFSIISGSSFILAPGASTAVVVQFLPPALGSFTSVVQFKSNGNWISMPVAGEAKVEISGRITTSPSVGGAGISVNLNGASTGTTITDGDGRYKFAVKPSNGYTVTPTGPGLAFTPSTRSVTVGTVDIGGLDFTAVPTLDYTLGNSGNISVIRGAPGATAITATLQAGATQPVSFAASGLPSGTSAGFTLDACSPTCSTVLTLTTTAATPAGSFPITVTGSPLGKTTTFTLVVTATFDYVLGNSGDVGVTQGASVGTTITATAQGGETQPVSFAVSGLPPGVAAGFAPGACNPTCATALTITTSGATPIGTFPVTVSGNPLGKTTAFNLVVSPPPVGFAYTLTNSGDISVASGASGQGSTTISATLQSGGLQPVSFGISGLPIGASAVFSADTCNPSCSTTLTIRITGATPTGRFPITVTGSPQGQTTTFALVVTSSAVFPRIGVFRTGSWFLDVSGNGMWSGCGADGCFGFGAHSDRAVAGDWTGTNRARIGVFRNGDWFLDLNGNGQWDGCGVDACLGFGAPGDEPVVGDWTGTGKAKIGVFRNGIWSLDRNGNGQWDGCVTDACPTFGTTGDIPVVGDWTGTGEVKLGVFRGGLWFLDLNGNAQWDGCAIDACFAFGAPGDQPVVGDWNGSGKAKIGILRDGGWYLDLNGNGQWDGCGVDGCIGFGQTGDQGVVGNW